MWLPDGRGSGRTGPRPAVVTWSRWTSPTTTASPPVDALRRPRPVCAEAARRLRDDGVLCQELPIRSGFHSPAFAAVPGSLPATPTPGSTSGPRRCRSGRRPRWRPDPDDPEAVRRLSLRHLVEPVRFRELAEALYDRAGVRCFVQLGYGSVKAFLDDTLHDRTVATVAAASPKRVRPGPAPPGGRRPLGGGGAGGLRPADRRPVRPGPAGPPPRGRRSTWARPSSTSDRCRPSWRRVRCPRRRSPSTPTCSATPPGARW